MESKSRVGYTTKKSDSIVNHTFFETTSEIDASRE